MAGRLAIPLFLIFIMYGCANTQRRYEILSFFFDGVPDPNAPTASLTSKAGSGRVTIVHKPYGEGKCDSCHQNTDDIFARAKVPPDICLTCHGDVPRAHAIMHGPVVNNACQMCHSPHSSGNAHLLKQPAPSICTQCHEPEGLTLMHRGNFDPKASCITCHSGHGGTDHRLLLAVSASPATQPASTDGSEVSR